MAGKRLISFSLYGDDPKYVRGFVENVRLARIYYPGWRVVCACDRSRPELGLADEPYCMGCSAGAEGMFWRLGTAARPDAQAILFRDCDSRLNQRESLAVSQWLASDKLVHSMHDHRHHRIHPLLGGMWGVRGRVFWDMDKRVAEWTRGKALSWGDDQRFLEQVIYPRVADSCLHHSSVEIQWPSVPFPVELPDGQFVGQQYDADGKGIWPA